ncbi:hypothetical protein AYO21_03172 [Fonsecaea monophora]|uniref:Xylanolytic transcriptional activator regulatory domain-containing protein n=1 Tax=Fonsecaea monophora TaxID=254056 RepID=A0A177FEJ8_9EURO|nr:hypothetical protein AYO21_03172 [Fonsecaea monophora]OAG42587.1 hypothetical protein AYO21_03172 [Fonsecaea monophora]
MAIHKLVEVFFNDVNWQYFIIEKQYFDSLLNCWYGTNVKTLLHLSHDELGRELYYFPALLCQVLGLAIQFLPLRSPVWEYLSQADMAVCHKYSDTGVELMTQRPHAALTVHWECNPVELLKIDPDVRKLIKLITSRSAQELELHRHEDPYKHASSSPGANLSRMWYEEYKRRLWMNLCTWDALTAMILGRPRAIHPDDCDVEEPIECNIPPDPSSCVPGSPEVIGGRDRPNTVSSNLFLYRLSNVWHAAKGQKADRPWSIDYSVVQQLHDQVHLIMGRLPLTLRYENPDLSWDDQYPYLRYQREDILTKANLMLVALHRPHIKYRAESRRAALQASIVILDSQHRSFIMARPHQYKFFGLSFYTIDASLLLSVVTARYLPQMDSAVMAKIDSILQQAMNRLSAMHSYSPIARSGLTILSQCYNVLQMRLERSTATWYLQKAVATEPGNFAQDSGVDVMGDSLSEQQSHLPLPQSQEHNQQEPVWGAPTSLSTGSGWTFDTSVDARTIPTTATQPSPHLEPSTTDFDETYWLSMINEVPDVTNTDPTEALKVGPTVEAASVEDNTVWNQIQFSESST